MDYSEFLKDEIDFLDSMINEEHPRYNVRSVESILVHLDPDVAPPGTTSIIQNDEDLFGYGVGNVQDLMSPDPLEEAKAFNDRGPSSSSKTS